MKNIKQYESYFDDQTLIDCDRNNKLDKLRILLKIGANINAQNSLGFTPLMAAVKANNISIIKELIQQGADLNITNLNGHSSALIMAAHHKFGHSKMTEEDILIIKMLIEAGADWSIKDNIGKDFLEHFNNKKNRNYIIKQYPKQYQEYLMKKNVEKYNL